MIIIMSENLLKKVKKYKRILGNVSYIIFLAMGFLEKFKNAVTWKHPKKT